MLIEETTTDGSDTRGIVAVAFALCLLLTLLQSLASLGFETATKHSITR